MHIGLLRQRLDVEYETTIGSTSEGVFEANKVWTPWKVGVPCAVSIRRGQEHFASTNDGHGGQRFSQDTWFFTVRYLSVDGIDPTMRIKHAGLTFDIKHIRADAQYKREMVLECEVQDAAIGAAPLIPAVLDMIPEGTVGEAYTGFTVSAEGGETPYSFDAESGDLPPGLDINPSTGTVTGTPTTAGEWPVEIIVSDAADTTRSLSFTITINAAAP